MGIRETMIKLLGLGLLGFSLLLVGLGRQLFLVKLVGVVVTGLTFLIIKLIKNKIAFPKYFRLWLVFLLILSLSFFWTKNTVASFEEWLLFLAGTGFWVIGFNLKKELRKHLWLILISLGLVFGGIWGYFQWVRGDLPVVPFSLWGHYSNYKNHLMLGDYWSGVLGILLVKLIKKPRSVFLWMLLSLGGYFVIISQSRAALVGLMVGVGYLASKNQFIKEKVFKWIGIGLVCMFFWMAMTKSTLLVRDYYLQTLVGLKDYPFGVGLRNFGLISENAKYHLWGRGDFAYNTHSLVFEMISAVGLLSLVFAYWLFKVIRKIWNSRGREGLGYRVAFIVYTINMLFFASFYSPTILWIWFLLLGMVN